MEEVLAESQLDLKFKLDNFEGPLDLLLHLIKETKLEIETIHLADITDQYLSYLHGIQTLDMEKASDFISIAATLLEIKSKKILPRPDEFLEEGEEDAEGRLKRQIEEYRLFKETAEKLKEIENVNRLYKKPEDEANNFRIILKDMNMDKLLDAFTGVLCKVQLQVKKTEILPKEIAKDRFTVAEKIASIQHLVEENEIVFNHLFDRYTTVSEVINTFLAVLELLKRQAITYTQDALYGNIVLRKGDGEFDITALLRDEVTYE